MSRTVQAIIQDLKKVNAELVEAVKSEVEGKSNEELIFIISSHSSEWSGGHSVRNMVEQLWRTLATDQLRMNIRYPD